MVKKVRKTSKKFLSDTPYEYGSVCWEVRVDPEDRYDLVQADLRIADCGNAVTLGFSSRKKRHMDYRIKKLDVLISELQAMREVLASDEVAQVVSKKIEAKKENKDERR